MSSPGDEFGVGFLAGGFLVSVAAILICGWAANDAKSRVENEAIKRGYAEVVLDGEKRTFKWKEAVNDQ